MPRKPNVIAIRVNDATKAKIKALADAENRTITNYLINLIDQQKVD